MIQIKSLIKEIHDVDTIHPKDVFNLYYLEFISSRNPEVVQSPYGREVYKHYLTNLKQKYLNLFKQLLYKQIYKYVTRNRVDPDFDRSKLSPTASSKDLMDMMAKTFRSDMQRRNTVWNAVAGYTYGLENASSPAQIFVNINGLNNAIHNTGGKIMLDPSKVSNYAQLGQAFNTADKIKNQNQWELLKGMVDKDIRDLLNQEEPISEVSSPERDRAIGRKIGLRDRLQNVDRDISTYSAEFQKGYKEIRRESWWQKFNDRLTDLAARMGSSRLR